MFGNVALTVQTRRLRQGVAVKWQQPPVWALCRSVAELRFRPRSLAVCVLRALLNPAQPEPAPEPGVSGTEMDTEWSSDCAMQAVCRSGLVWEEGIPDLSASP